MGQEAAAALLVQGHLDELQELSDHVIGRDLPAPVGEAADQLDATGHIRPPDPDDVATIEDLLARWEHDSSDNTLEAYRQHLRRFFRFCRDHEREPYSLLSLRDFLYQLAYERIRYLRAVERRREKPRKRGEEPGASAASLRLMVAAISRTWQARGLPPPRKYPQWSNWLSGLMRQLGQPVDQKTALSIEALRRALESIDATVDGVRRLRDRAIFVLGFHAALRISELVALDIEHIYREDAGWMVWLPSSKTDQDRSGRRVPLYEYADEPGICPVRAYHELVEALGVDEGPLFRGVSRYGRLRPGRLSARGARNIIKQWCDLNNISGHSLRIGYVTSASEAEASVEQIMVITRHKKPDMVLHYRQEHNLHKQGPGRL